MVNWTSEAGRIDSCAQGAVGCLVHRFGIGLHSDHCLDLQSFTGDWLGIGLLWRAFFFEGKKTAVFWGKIVWWMAKNVCFFLESFDDRRNFLMLFPLHAKNTWNPIQLGFFTRVFRLIQDARSWIKPWARNRMILGLYVPSAWEAQFLNGSDLVDIVLIIGDSHI